MEMTSADFEAIKQKVFEQVPEGTRRAAEMICEAAGVDPARGAAAIMVLEVEGKIIRHPGAMIERGGSPAVLPPPLPTDDQVHYMHQGREVAREEVLAVLLAAQADPKNWTLPHSVGVDSSVGAFTVYFSPNYMWPFGIVDPRPNGLRDKGCSPCFDTAENALRHAENLAKP